MNINCNNTTDSSSNESITSSKSTKSTKSILSFQSSKSSSSSQNDNEYNHNNNHDDKNDQDSTCNKSSLPIILIIGQLLSFVVALQGVTQSALATNCQLSAPTFTIGLVYFCLFIYFFLSKITCILSNNNTIVSNNNHSYKNIITTKRTNNHKYHNHISIKHEDLLEIEIDEENDTHELGDLITDQNAHDCNDSESLNKYTSNSNIFDRENNPYVVHLIKHNIDDENSFGYDDDVDYDDNNIQKNTTVDAIHNNNKQKSYSYLYNLLQLSTPIYVYILIALLDVYANYFTVLAFKYTTITSVTLLDASAIPASMILSKLYLKRNYTKLHIFGVILCMIGVTLNILCDYKDDVHDKALGHANNDSINVDKVLPNKLFGDSLAFIGGILFGVVNVLGEVIVTDYGGAAEYNGMLGLFGTIICLVQSYILEYNNIAIFLGLQNYTNDINNNTVCSTRKEQFLLILFIFLSVFNYVGTAKFLQYSEAAFLNLSLLTGDMWSVIFSIVSFHIIPKPIFFISLIITLFGVIVYERAPPPSSAETNYCKVQAYELTDTLSKHFDDNDEEMA